MLAMCILLLEAGDTERNPGPGTDNAVSILHLNVRSIRNKIKYIQDNFTALDILCFSETHLDLNVSSDLLCISNSYSKPYRKDRNCHGGGILMYINSNLFHCRRSDLELFCQESIWTEIKVKRNTYLIGLFYSPVTSDAIFCNNFNTNIEKTLEVTKNLIFVGDLNEDLLNPNYRNLRDIMLINSLQNVITNPARQDAILDPIVILDDMHYLDAGILNIPDNISEHKAIYVILPFQYNLQGSFTRLVWLYKKANFDLLKEKLSNYDWSVLHEGSLDDACSKFTDIFLDMAKLCIPSNLVVVRPNDKP